MGAGRKKEDESNGEFLKWQNILDRDVNYADEK